jgi:hypothetical protein
MRKKGLSILLLLLSFASYAQSDSATLLKYKIKLSYLSSLIYPGMSIGMEFPVSLGNNGNSIKKAGPGTFHKSRLISCDLNWYHHPDFHDNLYLTVEWIMRRTRNSGFISEFSCGPGISRTFLAGTTYKVSDIGNVTIVRNAGYYYAMVNAGGGFGYDLSARKQIPIEIYSRLLIISMFPYNSTLYFRPVLETGFRYSPGLRNRKGAHKEIQPGN